MPTNGSWTNTLGLGPLSLLRWLQMQQAQAGTQGQYTGQEQRDRLGKRGGNGSNGAQSGNGWKGKPPAADDFVRALSRLSVTGRGVGSSMPTPLYKRRRTTTGYCTRENSPGPSLPLQERPTRLCRYWKAGSCTHGDECKCARLTKTASAKCVAKTGDAKTARGRTAARTAEAIQGTSVWLLLGLVRGGGGGSS